MHKVRSDDITADAATSMLKRVVLILMVGPELSLEILAVFIFNILFYYGTGNAGERKI